MDFSKGGKAFSLTAMQMGPKVKVSADGTGLVMANQKMAAKADGSGASASNEPDAKAADEVLEAEPDSPLPVPSKRTMRSIGTGKMPGSDAPFRREIEASVPATLNSVLVFYRSELGKRGWQETAEGAIVKPDQVQLAFTSPDGPATLKLGRGKRARPRSISRRNIRPQPPRPTSYRSPASPS
jgi:hypothetical protein